MGLKFGSEDSYATEMQMVLRIANALKDAAGISLQSGRPSVAIGPHTVIDSINLPNPHPLLPSLLDAGFSHEIATSISEAYQLRAEELRKRIQNSLITTCREIAELPVVALASSSNKLLRTLVTSFTELYLRRLEQWKEEIIQRIEQVTKVPAKVARKSSRTFNQEYVPLLEHFFEENPFPTHADKMFLARKSNMRYRQIHVWFQNRRNRTKKEGKLLRKKSTYEGPLKSLAESCEPPTTCARHGIEAPKTSRAEPWERANETEFTRSNVQKDAFSSSSPSHAFPSSYPPACHYDPFPCKSGSVHFGRPEWKRASPRRLSLLSTSVDELVDRFSQLNIRDELRPKGPPKLHSHAATAAITVTPSCAPHPSLVLPKYRQPVIIAQRYPTVRAPVSSSTVFQNPSHTSKRVALVSLATNDLSDKWKTALLPRRLSDQMYNTRQDTISSETPSSPTSPRLHSSDFENCSCSFSDVSLLSTPPQITSTRELPQSFGSLCRSPYNNTSHLHDGRQSGRRTVVPSVAGSF